jgi:SNF2 family DNA or RNA helicase
MGLGKTIQTLALAQRLKEEMGQLPAPVLLICPTSVVTNWQKESERFTPNLTTLVHQGSQRHQNGAFVTAVQNVDVVLTSYALARRDEEMLKQVNWLGVVLDEAQNIKNANTKQARVIRSLPAGFRLALTGTPVENRLSELWSILHFLNPGYLGSQTKFRERFAIPIERNGDEGAAQQLRTLTRPFILRRVKTDPTVIQDLPDKQEVKVYCHLSEEQATLYEAVVRDAMQAIEAEEEGGIGRKGLVLSMLMQLKQICNHPAQYLHQTGAYNSFEDNDRSGKLGRLQALLDEILAEGDRLLIFSQFTEMAGLLKQFIQERFGVGVLYLHGGTPPTRRAEMVERFQQEKGGPPVFVLSLKAGGTGLNLTRANHVFHFDRWWNPAVENQATDRAFRIGQTRNVLVHKFVCLGTLEERIDQMIEDKKALAESIIGSGENWLTEMSTAGLRELVKLHRE